MNKTFKKIFSVCCAVITTLTATLFHSTNLRADDRKQKIVFAGPQKSGKTKLVSRICKNSYDSNYVATVAMDFERTPHQTWWDLSGQPKFYDAIACGFYRTDLCVLFISDTNQETEYFLKVIAENNVPNVVLCITKTDEVKPDHTAEIKLLDEIKDKLPGVNVFDEVLYTSAQNNKFRFCTPADYKTSDEYQIYDTETQKQVLADKLYELCGGKAEDFQSETYKEGTSCDKNKTTTSKGKKYALGLGIPAGLLTLIFGTAYYEYARHFGKQEKTKTKTNPATVSAK